MWENLLTVRKSILTLENFEQITAFNEKRDISGKLVDGIWATHVHDAFEVRILFQLNADGEVDFSRIEDIHITPPFQRHKGVDASEFKRMCCILIRDKEFVYGECHKPHCSFSLSTLPDAAVSKAEYSFCTAALNNYWIHNDQDLEYLRLILALLISFIAKLVNESQNITYSPAEAMAIYIRSNYYRRDLSVSEVAEKYGFSPNYVQKIFKAKYNCTLIEFIKQTRLNAARILLRKHQWQVKEVSAMCGFSYVHYFCKCYRKYFGNLPGEE